MIRVAMSWFSSLNVESPFFTGSKSAAFKISAFNPLIYVFNATVICCALCALGYQYLAFSAVSDWVVFSNKEANMVCVELLIVLLVVVKLLSTVLKALRISADTFSANMA